MKLIVACNNGNYIGKNGQLLWRCKADMKHFKTLTTNNIVIMGSTTFEQCLGSKELPKRINYVIGKKYINNLFETLIIANDAIYENKEIWIIGGESIYCQLVHLCDEIHISHIDDDQVGDTMFTIPKNYRGKVFNYYFSPDV